MFLKRMAYPDIKQDNLYIGSVVTVYARQLKLSEYGDTFTRKKFARGKESTFALIKPDVYQHTGKIIDSIYRNGFIISNMIRLYNHVWKYYYIFIYLFLIW